MLSYVRCLYFSDTPDYDLLRDLLLSIAKREKFNLNEKDYDWIRQTSITLTHHSEKPT